MSKRKYSDIWLHFEDEDGQKAKCNYCKAVLNFSGGCHSNLRRHLKSKHLTILNGETEIPTSEALFSLDDTNDDQRSTSSQIRTILNQYQTTEFINIPPPKRKEEHIDRQVLRTIVKGRHPFQLVEEPEFQKLIYDVSKCPGYTLPSKTALSNILLPSIYLELLQDIKAKLQSATAICLTTNRWTFESDVCYLALTAHYINSNTMLTSHLLACKEFQNKETVEHFYNYFKEVISDFKINNKIIAILSDNTPSIVAAIRRGAWQEIACFGHSLNLIVQVALAEIAETINKVKEIVDYQKEMNLSDLGLKQVTLGSWTTTFETIHRIYQSKDAVNTALLSYRPNLILTTYDWDIIRETIPILMSFNEVTAEISKEKTLSKVTVMCNLLEECISKFVPSNEKVAKMVSSLQRGLASHFGNLEKNYLYAESIILDPRFKRKGFKNYDLYEQALSILRSRISSIRLPVAGEEVSATTGTIAAEHESIWEAYDLEFNTTLRPDDTDTCISELYKYVNEDYIDRTKDPLLWWKERKNVYPRVYSFVLKRLCLMATSLPCEQIFSANGQIMKEKCSSLKPSQVEEFIFVCKNL